MKPIDAFETTVNLVPIMCIGSLISGIVVGYSSVYDAITSTIFGIGVAMMLVYVAARLQNI